MTTPTLESARAVAVKLGAAGPYVFRLGLGCMAMSGMYGATDDGESIRTIHEAMERGITLLDTGDFYGMGHNEMVVGRALVGRRDRALVSVKFGAMRGPDGAWLGFDARPAAVKSFAAYSLKRLGVEVIDIYRPSRLDPAVPIEDTVGAVTDLIKAGYVRHLGLSEVGPDTIRRAHRVHPVVDLQIEYSLASRRPEQSIFPVLEELGICATIYGVLSRGLLTGKKPSGRGDMRAYLPRFSAAALAKNDQVVAALHRFASDRGMSVSQLAFAWVIARRPTFVPLVGARTREQLADAFGALRVSLSKDDLKALEALVPDGAIAGDRYGAEQMKTLDSER